MKILHIVRNIIRKSEPFLFNLNESLVYSIPLVEFFSLLNSKILSGKVRGVAFVPIAFN